MEKLVSIITPCYNAAKYIGDTIESVLKQLYNKWEMIIVDDCSNDNTLEIVNKYQEKDTRIKVYKTNTPSGSPVLPRNIGLSKAQGNYIAFLDADDLWFPEKLQQQISLFNNNKVAIVFSDYEKMDNNGRLNNRIIHAPKSVDYKTLLKGDVIGTLTAIVDKDKIGSSIQFKNIGAEDYLFFLEILKKGYIAVNTETILARYRQSRKSLSSNKLLSASWNWNIYRNELRFSIVKSIYYFLHYSIKALIKYLK